MATSTKSKPGTATTAKNAATSVAEDVKDGFDRVKDAIPSMEDAASEIQDYVQDHTNVDLQRLADDATTFVRRNPATSLAAAAGVGILIGILATRRS